MNDIYASIWLKRMREKDSLPKKMVINESLNGIISSKNASIYPRLMANCDTNAAFDLSLLSHRHDSRGSEPIDKQPLPLQQLEDQPLDLRVDGKKPALVSQPPSPSPLKDENMNLIATKSCTESIGEQQSILAPFRNFPLFLNNFTPNFPSLHPSLMLEALYNQQYKSLVPNNCYNNNHEHPSCSSSTTTTSSSSSSTCTTTTATSLPISSSTTTKVPYLGTTPLLNSAKEDDEKTIPTIKPKIKANLAQVSKNTPPPPNLSRLKDRYVTPLKYFYIRDYCKT